MKTDAGTNRTVSIHPKIQVLVNELHMEAASRGSSFLVYDTGSHICSSSKMTYDKYQNRFKSTIKELGINQEYRAHDDSSLNKNNYLAIPSKSNSCSIFCSFYGI